MKRTFESRNGRKIWVETIAPDAMFNSQFLAHLMAPGYVIAFWAPQHEGPELRPVGARITEEDVDAEIMMEALRYGQKLSELSLTADANTHPQGGEDAK